MRLGSLKGTTKDGVAIFVNQQQDRYCFATENKSSLFEIITNYSLYSENLNLRWQQFSLGKIKDIFPLNIKTLMAPLSRSAQWLDGSAYVHHVELARKSRGAEMPESFWHDPLMYQGASDCFDAPNSTFCLFDEEWGLDFEGEIFIVTDDVPQGVNREEAFKKILFFGLLNDWSYRNLIANELSKGFGFVQSKPHCSMAPFLISPFLVEGLFDKGRLNCQVECKRNSEWIGAPNASVDMVFDFLDLMVHAAKGRSLGAGSIIGGGTVSNKDAKAGSACLVEKRMLEKLNKNEISTSYLKVGDHVEIKAHYQGEDIFGSIDQLIIGKNKG